MISKFEKFAAKSNEFLNELALELDIDSDKDQAYRITRAVLHSVRNLITVEEAFQVLAQLPMGLKAVFVDGWTLHKMKKIRTINDFLDELESNQEKSAWVNFNSEDEILDAVIITLRTLRKHISEGEFENIKACLPRQLKQLVPESKNKNSILL
jgi:uncharacterized protein (DUF2267 family)